MALSTAMQAGNIPDDFPRFVVPGHEREMAALRALYWLHYEPAGPLGPSWDEWMTTGTLWPACAPKPPAVGMRRRWAAALAAHPINAEGYVHTQQHDGPAHAEGWPFPRWMEAGGIGWHFRGIGVAGYEPQVVAPQGWSVAGGQVGPVGEKGWTIALDQPAGSAQTPAFSVEAANAPWLRLNWWASGLEGADPYVEWATQEDARFAPDRRAYFSPAKSLETSPVETRTMIPVYRISGWKGQITGLRLCFNNPGAAQVVIKSFHTACDTRHNVNNTGFIRGFKHYFMWSRDLAFLREQIGRLRHALRFMMSEFDTRRRNCVYTAWPGHEGRSGVRWSAGGEKTIVIGQGIGNNYWDLLPFGGEDALATIYYYDALLDLADLEEQIAEHPSWCVPAAADAFDPTDLREHAWQVREYGRRRFWNEDTGRFGTVDLDGVLHDYGFTFLNNEAICYGFAAPAQGRAIRDWISGRRIVQGDTSTGADIYHWRFGPRSTTRRNVDYYYWAWSNPEQIPWGYQVQDGGAVLGFSYHDLMACLIIDGPDDAWQRLQEITTWFEETQAAGGYRAYYGNPARGTMQGDNVAGGLGLDKEFYESILVPQIMLYGFLGLQPTVDGFSLHPRLPKEWPALTITGIHIHGCVIAVTVTGNTVSVEGTAAPGEELVVDLARGWKLGFSAAFVRALCEETR